jgi:predicted metal-dependent phosphoesterase TrpH
MRYADLHLHTHHSDGTRSPREVIDLAVAKDLGIVAISDHDNVAAWFEIRDYAEEQDVLLVPATELSSEFKEVDVHILAYAFDPADESLARRLASFRETRERRGELMVERLNEHGYPISMERVKEFCGGGSMGRPHVARALVEAGHCKSFEEAFARFLVPGRPTYVGKERFSIEEAVELVHRTGGLLSVAHPTLYPDHRRLVPEILDRGVDAIETLHPDVDAVSRLHYEALAAERGIFITGGSDDHGSAKTAQTIGTVKVPESTIGPILDRMRR